MNRVNNSFTDKKNTDSVSSVESMKEIAENELDEQELSDSSLEAVSAGANTLSESDYALEFPSSGRCSYFRNMVESRDRKPVRCDYCFWMLEQKIGSEPSVAYCMKFGIVAPY